MRDWLCRVTVCAPRSGAAAVDVNVPADCPVGTLLPDLVDVVVGPSSQDGPHRWHLSRLTGGVLDTSNGLRDNGVEDGDVLVLDAAGVPAPRRSSVDAASLVADHARPGAVLPSLLLEGAGLAVVAVLAVALVWPGGPDVRLWCAAALAAAAAIIGTADRRCPLPTTLNVGAPVFAAATGYLALPQASWQLSVAFAAGAGCAMAALLGRVTASTMHVAAGTAAGLVTAAAAVSATASLSTGGAGAVLVSASVAALTVAPRMVIGAAGLSPARETIEPGRAAAAHRLLTGLVIGCSATAALGAVALAAASAVPAVALAVDVGVLLSLRARHHHDPARRIALGAAGLVGCATGWVGTALLWSAHLHWLCAGAALAGMALTYRTQCGSELTPVVRQGVQVLEYAALVVVVPLALWVTGAYGWARGLGLS
ncbi:type VII secretion integral membrane protein EccD [Mycobacterium sp. SMC-4]|uniref:type VII secretion integral membrane protein EccD n=1 Tax=Mycobacterium sp. SMC-4 TaxID=2857059 RepID=UPI003CFCEAB4